MPRFEDFAATILVIFIYIMICSCLLQRYKIQHFYGNYRLHSIEVVVTVVETIEETLEMISMEEDQMEVVEAAAVVVAEVTLLK